ncbi:ras-related protein Rab-13-like [Mercenaria mercenaria]|uniref:ras-related protein Rab-13-like n=1 Tax=Mercenaria mercenaria TaxID=6596 RepID=UPI00234F2A5E|nr:ras-related protein Rab-13-like [Mercenaria mercenaria]
MAKAESHVFRLAIVGCSAVGKSCMLQRFCKGTFSEKHVETPGVDFVIKGIALDEENINLYIWDTCDDVSHRALVDFHCSSAMGYIVVYDITSEETFDDIDARIKHLKEVF